jgi:hypothetical protein
MTMKTKIIVCLGALLCVAAAVQQVGWPVAKLTVRVVGEQGEPIAGSKVKIGFREKFSNRDERTIGETDARGEFTAEGHSDMRLLSGASKEGYYDSGSPSTIFKDAILGKWQPWNPVEELVLRTIGKPVAMHAKRVKGDIPVLDQPCSYDLEKGDWVAPHGKGEKPDLTFKVRRDYTDRDNFKVEAEVVFAQRLDGVLGMKSPSYARNSVFRWERSAPEIGYESPHRINFASSKRPTHVDRKKSFETGKEFERGYFFRVRTVEQNGRIVAANYGKITGDIVIDPRDTKTCYVSFTYYFNPTSLDRNLEWDTKRNLLQGLSHEETPQHP